MATKEQAIAEVQKWQSSWFNGRRLWSGTYHGLLIGAAVLAAATAAAVALDGPKWSSVLLAFLSAIASSLSLIFKPGEKRRAHRLAWASAEKIRLYLLTGAAVPDRALNRLSEVIQTYEDAMSGGDPLTIAEVTRLEEQLEKP